MGYQSTRTLTREEAVAKYAELKAALKKRKWESQAYAMSNHELGDKLEELCDKIAARNNTTNFDNFLVTNDEPKST